ncbi:MAG TPA: AAA family ATPase [Conexibacter sp.]|nr:AAA family ATPase [Conexibacter sp.]
MRIVDRPNVSEPDIFRTKAARAAYAAAARHFSAEDARARQTLHQFTDELFGAPSVRRALAELFLQKCAFCESAIADPTMGEVHHFRPVQGAVDPRDGSVSDEHYWWLAYAWENLYWACRSCVVAAGTRFPVDGPRASSKSTGSSLDAERKLLLDPCGRDEAPDAALFFDEDGRVEPLHERGQLTIETYDLNRADLIDARAKVLGRAMLAMASGGRLGGFLHASQPYVGVLRQFVSRVSGSNEGQASSDRSRSDRPSGLTPRPRRRLVPLLVRSIEIENFLAIQSLRIDLPPRADAGPWTVLLGENGAGKTSVVKAVALALMGELRRTVDLTPDQALHDDAERGSITVDVGGSAAPRRIHFRRGDTHFRATGGDDTPAVIAAYGAHRPLGGAVPQEHVGQPRVANLFSPERQLADAKAWLLSCDEQAFNAAARALKRLLVKDDVVLRRDRDEIHLDWDHGRSSTLDQLSDGYRSMIGLAADLMLFLVGQWGSLEAAEGIVLIDEVSTHLHPRWQMRIVQAFRDAFPRLQFIVTTHDPLCLRGLRRGEVIVLRETRRGRVSAITDLPDVSGLMVDQLLTSEHFGLSSTIDPELERTFEEYYKLLADPQRDAAAEQRRKELRALLAERRQLGFTRREEMALDAADEYLAGEPNIEDEPRRRLREDKARREIREIWAQHGL